MDPQVNHAKLAITSLYLQQEGVMWITTNEDPYGVSETGLRTPGNGQYVAQIEMGLKDASGDLMCEKVCTGKPNPGIIDIIRKHHDIPESDLRKMVMIGDNCETDIALGNNAGISSCLVMTGVVKDENQAI